MFFVIFTMAYGVVWRFENADRGFSERDRDEDVGTLRKIFFGGGGGRWGRGLKAQLNTNFHPVLFFYSDPVQ